MTPKQARSLKSGDIFWVYEDSHYIKFKVVKHHLDKKTLLKDQDGVFYLCFCNCNCDELFNFLHFTYTMDICNAFLTREEAEKNRIKSKIVKAKKNITQQKEDIKNAHIPKRYHPILMI